MNLTMFSPALGHVRVHVFGHIHVGRGVQFVRWDAMQKVCVRGEWIGVG